MSYENAIETYHRIYDLVDVDSLVALWKENTGPLHVYVHSPFCASICKFCYYKGVQFGFDKDAALYDQFYDDYLPRAIEPFRFVLDSRRVDNYFFGGGTPSLMKPETMERVFRLLPGFDAVRSKTFEIHPALWSEEQLDLLAGHGFNCCIIGIQSFDAAVLERQGRLHAPFERVRDLARAIRARGMRVAGDLIYRMDEIDAEAIFVRDLSLVDEIDCDVLSLQLNYDTIADEAYNAKFFELIFASALASRYYWEGGESISIALKKTLKCFRYVRKDLPFPVYDREVFPFIRTIDEGSKVLRPGLPSVIGFGSYKNPRKNTFSNIRSDTATVEYIEVNDAWTPTYFVTYDSRTRDFFDECEAELQRFREIGPPPRGVKISFENQVPRAKENYIFRRVESRVAVGVTWEYTNAEIQRYLDELKRVFPNWEWPTS
jgi:hypothetical protein